MSTQIMQTKESSNMEKNMKKALVLIVSILAILLCTSIYNRIKIQNIFDEIYYDSAGASGDGFDRRSRLGNIPDISPSAMDLSGIAVPEGEHGIMETYKNESLKSPMQSLSIVNNSTRKKLSISYSYTVASSIIIFFENSYDVKTKELTKKITFLEVDSGERITSGEGIENMLSKYNITRKKLDVWYEQGMNKMLLKDWISVYPSKYSIENQGNVKMKNKW